MKYFIGFLLSIAATVSANAQLITPDTIVGKKGNIIVQPVQHASLVLTSNSTVVYVDPASPDLYKDLQRPAIIVITDIHGDHFNQKNIEGLMTANTILVVPQVVADKLPETDKAHLVVLHNGETSIQSGIIIKAIPMYNLPESSTAMHTKGRGNGYVLGMAGKNIYISGDTQGIPEMRSLKNIDVAFVCMNLPYTMDVKEASDAVLAFKPSIVYPYHYRGQNGLSDTNAFKSAVDAGNEKIEVRLRNWYAVK